MIPLASQSIIWIRVEKPTLDIVGVVVSSFGIAAVCIGVAVCLGTVWGGWLIMHGRGRCSAESALGLSAFRTH